MNSLEAENIKNFEDIYRSHFKKIYTYILSRTSSTLNADDITEEVFIKLLNSKNLEFKNDLYLFGWLYKVARNCIVDYYRSNKICLDLEHFPEIPANDLLPEDLVNRQMLFAEIRSELENLPEVQRETIILKFFSEYSNKEIALMLNVKERTVSANLVKGVKNLRKKLIDKGSIVE
jgi:RNA polymerase sigma factor (sigma-70 family)